MTKNYLFRLVLLAVALALVAVLTLWAVQQSWRRINSLESRLTAGQLESLRLADEFHNRLRFLNNTVLRFTARGDASALTQFQQASAALNGWIDRHDPKLNQQSDLASDQERRLFHQLNETYDDYLIAATGVLSNQQPALVTTEAIVQLDRFEQQSLRLFDLGSQLAEAHRQAQENFLRTANRELAGLRTLLMSAIIVMVTIFSLLAAVLYRDLVKPLRVRLGQSEALLERQEKLATLGTLAAGIAHEVRNPLTSIKARLYTLGKQIKSNPPAVADANIISSEITRLERVVQDVLSFARPSDPKLIVAPAETALREVYSLMACTLEKNGVRLMLEPGGNTSTSMDVALIKQVLINLVQNAAEATGEGGTVTLRARADRATLNGAEQAVTILEVADTGKGIPPEVEGRLFDPFFTTKEAGTGLGLSIAARIVEKHGGLLQYRTQVGRGTTFGIVLPSTTPEPCDPRSANRKD